MKSVVRGSVKAEMDKLEMEEIPGAIHHDTMQPNRFDIGESKGN